MARWPRARWNPVPNYSGTTEIRSVCLHHQAGWGDPASVYLARDVSAHFWIPIAGEPVQHVDTAHRAWHGGTNALNTYAIGVETEGCGADPYADPLSENQLALFGELMAWAHATHGVPLVLSEAADAPGLNYHRCSGGYATGCPCDVRVNARAEILRRAGGVASAPSPPSGPASPGQAPPFPLPPGYYYGPADGPTESVSGYYPPHGGPNGADGLRTWQAQVGGIDADGFYGDETEAAAYSVQAAAGIDTDGLIGPDTWAAAWR